MNPYRDDPDPRRVLKVQFTDFWDDSVRVFTLTAELDDLTWAFAITSMSEAEARVAAELLKTHVPFPFQFGRPKTVEDKVRPMTFFCVPRWEYRI